MDTNNYYDFAISVSKEFFDFMNTQKYSNNVIVKIDNSIEDCGSYTKRGSDQIVLLNQTKLEEYSDNGTGIIFHEFTHYLDDMTFTLIEGDDRQSFLNLYSEFHATHIQMMKWCGFASIQESSEISPFYSIPGVGNALPLVDFFALENHIAKKLVEFYTNDHSTYAINRLLKRALYVGGEFWFAQNFVRINIEKVIDLSIFAKRFGQPILDLIQCFMADTSLTNPIIRKVFSLYNEITLNEAKSRV